MYYWLTYPFLCSFSVHRFSQEARETCELQAVILTTSQWHLLESIYAIPHQDTITQYDVCCCVRRVPTVSRTPDPSLSCSIFHLNQQLWSLWCNAPTHYFFFFSRLMCHSLVWSCVYKPFLHMFLNLYISFMILIWSVQVVYMLHVREWSWPVGLYICMRVAYIIVMGGEGLVNY